MTLFTYQVKLVDKVGMVKMVTVQAESATDAIAKAKKQVGNGWTVTSYAPIRAD